MAFPLILPAAKEVVSLPVWDASLSGTTVGEWAVALAVAAAVAGAARLLQAAVRRWLRVCARRAPGEVDDLLLIQSACPPHTIYVHGGPVRPLPGVAGP
ncbi:MAG: hypothetical protein QN211_01095 [Armatimonadota bacterium]|nr:hypothetical protein [Armatimonadota bacterium]MDR7471507.1 hypothetical protein [Armatimonadota bacterium]MDR7582014.1 hypothetical protein [Armatimonadota bacterium]